MGRTKAPANAPANDQQSPPPSIRAALPEVGPEDNVELVLFEWGQPFTFEEVQAEYIRLDNMHREVLARLSNVEEEVSEAVRNAESEILDQAEEGGATDARPASVVERTVEELRALIPREYVLRKRAATMLLIARLKQTAALTVEREERSGRVAELTAKRDEVQSALDQELYAARDLAAELQQVQINKHDVAAWRELQNPKGQMRNLGSLLYGASSAGGTHGEQAPSPGWSGKPITFGAM